MKTDTRCWNDIRYKFTFRRNTGRTILEGHLCRRYLLRGLILQKWAGKRIEVFFANGVSSQPEWVIYIIKQPAIAFLNF